MIAREYRPGDIDRVDLGENEQAEMAVLGDEVAEAMRHHDGPVWSLVEGDKVLGVWGTRLIDGDGHTWAVLSPEARKKPVSLHKCARHCMAESEKVANRLFGLTMDDTAHRWAVRLGFEEIDPVEFKGMIYRRYLWRSAQ